jgi:polar amino acid transport system substrate-binding protein
MRPILPRRIDNTASAPPLDGVGTTSMAQPKASEPARRLFAQGAGERLHWGRRSQHTLEQSCHDLLRTYHRTSFFKEYLAKRILTSLGSLAPIKYSRLYLCSERARIQFIKHTAGWPFMKILSLLSLLVTLLGIAPTALAVELQACLIQLEPWAFPRQNADGKTETVGIMFDMLREFEARSGDRLKPRLLPYARVELELEQGMCDFALMAWADTRAAYANKGTIFMPLEFGVIGVKGVKINNYDDLKPLTISIARGLKIAPQFDSDKSLKKNEDLDNLTGVRKAAANRVGAVAGSITTLQYLIRQNGLRDRFEDIMVMRRNDFALAFSKKSPKIDSQTEVNRIFSKMVSDGTIQKIYDKWMQP